MAQVSAATSRTSSVGATVRRSRTTRSRSIRPMTQGSAARRRARRSAAARPVEVATATPIDGNVSPGTEPPPTVASSSHDRDRPGGEGGHERLRPPSQRRDRRREHPPDGDLGRRPAGPVEREGGGDGGEDRLVRPHRASQRVLPEPFDQVAPADDQPGLRSADQLVAGERHEVRPGRQPLARGRLVDEADPLRRQEGAAAEIVDDDRAVPVGDLGEQRGDPALPRTPTGRSSRDGPGARRGCGPSGRRAPPRSRRRGSGSSCRPRRDARRPAAGSRGSARRRRSRRAPRARRPRLPRARPARRRGRWPPRCW